MSIIVVGISLSECIFFIIDPHRSICRVGDCQRFVLNGSQHRRGPLAWLVGFYIYQLVRGIGCDG